MKSIVFVCVENSCRSQMAEALAKMYMENRGAETIKVFSAGSNPSGQVNPMAVCSMGLLGYDLSEHKSKSLKEIPDIEYEAVITMGCGDECPWIKTKRREDWNIPDPKHMQPKAFGLVRDEIASKVEALMETL